MEQNKKYKLPKMVSGKYEFLTIEQYEFGGDAYFLSTSPDENGDVDSEIITTNIIFMGEGVTTFDTNNCRDIVTELENMGVAKLGTSLTSGFVNYPRASLNYDKLKGISEVASKQKKQSFSKEYNLVKKLDLYEKDIFKGINFDEITTPELKNIHSMIIEQGLKTQEELFSSEGIDSSYWQDDYNNEQKNYDIVRNELLKRNLSTAKNLSSAINQRESDGEINYKEINPQLDFFQQNSLER